MKLATYPIIALLRGAENTLLGIEPAVKNAVSTNVSRVQNLTEES
jgi:hypothetical protein